MRLPALACCLLFPLVASAESPDTATNRIRVSPETTHITGPLTKEGLVDYRTYLNQKHSAGVTPEQNAVVWYWRAIGPDHREASPEFRQAVQPLLGADLFSDRWARIIDGGKFSRQKMNAGELGSFEEWNQIWEKTTEKPWTAEDYPLVAEWLEKNERSLELVEKAGQQPHYYSPIVESEMLYLTLLPRVQLQREFARMLNSRALLRAGEGDFEGASRDLITMFQMGEKLGQGCMFIEGLVGAAIYSIAEATLEEVVTNTDIGEKQLLSLQKELEKIQPAYDLVRIVDEGERYFCLDAIQYASRAEPREFLKILDFGGLDVFEDDYQKIALTGIYWKLMSSGVDWNVALEDTNRHFDLIVTAMSQPTKEARKGVFKEVFNETDRARREAQSFSLLAVSLIIPEAGDKRVSQFMLWSLVPAFQQVEEAWCRAEVRRRVSPLGCAIERYRRQKEKYPANLQALVPSYIDALPLDPYTDQPFHYRVNADRSEFAVFTFGPNGKDENGATWGEVEGLPQADDMGLHSPDWLQ